jgi:cysteine desulfurase
MYANNEIGTIQPIRELAQIAHEGGAVFHTDAVQAVGHLPIDVKDMDIDALSFSAHKFGGPKGIGGLYLKNGVRLPNLLTGGQQERGRRSGTENTPGIIGTAKALTLAAQEMQENIAKVTKLRDKLIDGMLKIPYARLNGDREQRLPGNVNISIPFIEGESLLLWLDIEGICASSGSACTSASLDPSHVLLSIGLPHEIAHGSLRFSLNHTNTEEDIDYILEKLPPIVEKLRNMSPLWNEREN